MIDLLGNKRVLDTVISESGTSTARTISLYRSIFFRRYD